VSGRPVRCRQVGTGRLTAVSRTYLFEIRPLSMAVHEITANLRLPSFATVWEADV
jgi:hypothetical protein